MSLKSMSDLIDIVKYLTSDNVHIKEYIFTPDGNGFVVELTNGKKYEFYIGQGVEYKRTLEHGKCFLGSVTYD